MEHTLSIVLQNKYYDLDMALKLTHEQCREEMCAACGGRAGKRKVTPHIGEMIKKGEQAGSQT